jgi:hypothetical protein
VSLPRISIAKLLVVVAVVALNLAVVRAVRDHDREFSIFCGVPLGAVALTTAFLLLIRSRSSSRAFWAGFLAFSLLALAVYLEASLDPPTYQPSKPGGTGFDMVMTRPGSTMWHVLDRYLSTVFQLLRPYVGDPFDQRTQSVLLRCVVNYLPQGVVAATGGFACWIVVRFVKQ